MSYYPRSLYFVKSNQQYHESVNKSIVQNTGEIICFTPYNYNSLQNALLGLDSLFLRNTLYSEILKDNDVIVDEELKKHIKFSLSQWRHYPFTQKISFNQFCEYVLPYRAGNKQYSDYLGKIISRYSWVLDSMVDNPDPIEVTTIINNEIMTWLEFDLRSHAELNEPSIIELLEQKKGSCNSLTQFVAQVCRSIGIPVALDECPFWGHRNSGHKWNVVLDNSGKWIPFGGAETNPFQFISINDSVKAPKIFRYTFSHNSSFQPPGTDLEDLPPVFKSANRIDVTKDYVSTSDVAIELNLETDKGKILYLSIFNGMTWRIIAWSKIEDGRALFSDIGNDSIVYLPVLYQNGKSIPVGQPIVLTENSCVEIIADESKVQDLHLPLYNKFFGGAWNVGFPEISDEFELLYWNNQWVSVGKTIADDNGQLNYSRVPTGALYLLKFCDKPNTWQRIFQIENGFQLWY